MENIINYWFNNFRNGIINCLTSFGYGSGYYFLFLMLSLIITVNGIVALLNIFKRKGSL